MNDTYLSKLMTFANSQEAKIEFQEKNSKIKEPNSCLPSFLLKDDLDGLSQDEDSGSDESDENTSESLFAHGRKRLTAPKKSQNGSQKFFSPDDVKKTTSFPYPLHSQMPTSYLPNQIQQYPSSQSIPQLSQPITQIPQPMQNTKFYQNTSMNMTNGYQNNYQQFKSFQPHPPSQNSYMHNAASFNYSTVNNILNTNFTMNQPNMIPRMNSFGFGDGIGRNLNVGGSSMSLSHVPGRIQSQNNFYCGLSKNNVIHPPSSKKSSQSPSSPKKGKKKAPKKSTADSESLSINSILNLNDNELYSYIITQKGSREIQSILKKVAESEVDALIAKLSPHFADIMIDKYGNYFSQRLIQICSPNQRVALLKSIQSRFTEICINSFGTHPLQSLIEIVNMPKEREILLKCIEGNELELSLDSKGTHVIQKFISCSNEEERGNVDKNILANLPKLINDSFGVCVLIKLIKQTNDKSIKETIANYISANNALSFIQNPYANYVVQSLFNQNDIHLCDEIIKTIVEHFFSLSMQKFSSNVVENCIRYSDEPVVKKIYKDIINTGKLGSMLNNTYGNFVIEKLIGRLTKEEKGELIKEITKLGKEKNLSNTIMNLLYKQ